MQRRGDEYEQEGEGRHAALDAPRARTARLSTLKEALKNSYRI
jgi:hypothetical protein